MRSQAPGKLLLFGEYAVLLGGNALATPVTQFGGQITFEKPRGSLSKAQGRLSELSVHPAIAALTWLHRDHLVADLAKGMWIRSNIPSGYGLGSSGMVTALLYANYADQNHASLSELKSRLAAIESFFHGSSSGIDPLTSLLNQVLHITEAGLKVTALAQFPKTDHHLYLLDSKRKRNTAHLVQAFKQSKQENPEFAQSSSELVPCTELALNAFLNSETDFERKLRQLSSLQFRLFNASFIQPGLRALWQEGLAKETYTMKLCGAGGGGFYQVWSKKPLGSELGGFPLIRIF